MPMTPYQLFVEKWGKCRECSLWEGRQRVVLCRGKVPADVLFIGEGPGESEDSIGQPFIGPAGHLLDQILEQSGVTEHRYCLTNLVCCIPRLKPPVVVNIHHKAEYDIAIGRPSEWGNPWIIGRDGTRDEVIDRYAEYLQTKSTLLNKLPQLSRKRLGCYCKPARCHGDVIVEAFNRLVSGKADEPPIEAIRACRPRLLEMVELARPRLIVCVGRLASKWLPDEAREGRSIIGIMHPAAVLRAELETQKQMAIRRCIVAISDAVDGL